MGLQALNPVGVGLFAAITDVIWLTSAYAFTDAVYDDENEWELELTQALFYGFGLGLVAWSGYHAYVTLGSINVHAGCFEPPSLSVSFTLFNQVFTGILGWVLGYLISKSVLDSDNDHEIAFGIGLGAALLSCIGQAAQERICDGKIVSNGAQWTVAAIGAFVTAAAWYYIAELEIQDFSEEMNATARIILLSLSSGGGGWAQVEVASRCEGKTPSAFL